MPYYTILFLCSKNSSQKVKLPYYVENNHFLIYIVISESEFDYWLLVTPGFVKSHANLMKPKIENLLKRNCDKVGVNYVAIYIVFITYILI